MHARATTTRRAAAVTAVVVLATVPATAAEAAPTGTADILGSVDYATWKQDVAAVVAQARPWIESRTAGAGGEKQAIVLDIDNTALETYFHPIWQQPTPAVAAVRDLARYADSRGVAVYFVTARPGIVGSLTEWNLKQTGYPVDGLYLTDLSDLFEVSAYKTEKRAEIEAKGYRIIANIGNSSGDFAGGHAERAFKLPDYGGRLF
ncbi:HAD family acid phosphatase (plasmid) [Streptomyces sp. HUAS 31]|uniref:HAD family acid phosphatase n=1 Tax=Streptomyces TaxID=1883 RepID=UPI002306D856|nr:HAD family acid phosphatase [Streptomyces sp. HUAS 31]WCE02478.1 HAD family acid phosphatase [Streptomyces sp. HUAS 31]